MQIHEAQQEVRTVYVGGFWGQIVSGVIWLTAAALATWRSPASAMLALVAGGFMIFPITTAVLAALGRPTALSSTNPFKHLAMQVAFVLPASMPLVAPVTVYHQAWFFPSVTILLGAHYLPFATLYGMRSFLVLAGVLIAAGMAIAQLAPASFSLSGWVTGAVLIVFAFVLRAEAARLARTL